MKFRYTLLYVENVVSTIEFYEQAFGFQRSMIHESEDYGELNTGETKLGFVAIAMMQEMHGSVAQAKDHPPSFELAFETEDVSAAVQKAVDAGANLVQPPKDMPWGQTIAYVHDLNGFLIEICSPMSND